MNGFVRSLCKQICRGLLVVLLFTLNACGKSPAPPLRIATNPWSGYEFLHLAEELGYFTQEGVSVRLVEFTSLGDARRAFERGQVDAWGATLVELLFSREQSPRHAQVFMVTDFSNGADMLLARPPIVQVAELRGRRVAVEPATTDVLLLAIALKSAGLRFDEIELTPLPQNLMVRALQSGEVDAVCTYPPLATTILRAGLAGKIFDSTQAPQQIIDVLAADQELLAQRADAFAAIIRAFERARRYAETHPDHAHALMARREGLSVEEFRQALSGIRIVAWHEQGDYLAENGYLLPALQAADRALRALGLLKGPAADASAYQITPWRISTPP